VSALVVDSSIVVYALTVGAHDHVLRRRLSEPRLLHAPALLDFEVLHAVRGLTLGRRVAPGRAELAVADFCDLHIERYPGAALAGRMWQLRGNFTAHDAAYIALAELLGCPLLTGDGKLRGSHRAVVELYPWTRMS